MKKNNISGNEDEKMVIQAKENYIATVNQEIRSLMETVHALNKEISILRDNLEKLGAFIPRSLNIIENDVLNKCIENDKKRYTENLDDLGRDALDRKDKLDSIVKMQKGKIKALKKILIPHLIEQIKLELEKDINMDENKEFKKQINTIERELNKLSIKKNNLLKQMEKYNDDKKKVAQNQLNTIMPKSKKSISILDRDRKSYYETEAKKFAKLKEMYGWEKYTQNIIMLTLQSFGDVNQASYENMKNKVAEHTDEKKKLIDSITKAICEGKIKFETLAQLGENLIFKTKLLELDEINKIKDMVNNKAELEDFRTIIFNNKLDKLKKSFDEVRNLSLLNLILSGQDFDLEKLEKNITEETRSQNYFWSACQNEWRIESREQEIQKYKNLTNELTKMVPVQNQNQNHGIFNMINNAQNQNNNDIPQMENDNNINQINIINED